MDKTWNRKNSRARQSELRAMTPDKSAREIAAELGCKVSRVHCLARTHGRQIKYTNPRVTSREGYAELKVKALSMKGSMDVVAGLLGVHRMTIYRWRKEKSQTQSSAA